MNENILVAVLTETKVTSLTLDIQEYILGSRLKLGNFGANED